jgi:RHS repeat-associated protein
LTAGYVYGNDLISQRCGNADSFYLVDGLGSTRGLINASGVVTDAYTYDAFGNLIASTGSTTNNYRFAGEQFDPNLGDYYLRQRYYDSDTGRFNRMDSYEGRIFDPVSRHKYLYANANPVNFIDPSGFAATTIAQQNNILVTLAILATIGGAIGVATSTIEKAEDQRKRTFYRGTSYYDVLETVATQRIDVERIMASQIRLGYPPDRQGVYFTSQLSTAQYYASYVGREGKKGGPGVIIALVSERKFDLFVLKYGIAVEVPVPTPPRPGQTETIIPYNAMPEFETFTEYSAL